MRNKKYTFSDDYQQHTYSVTFNEVGDYKHMVMTTNYQGAKFPAPFQNKVEMYMNENEWKTFKKIIDSID